jgi:hypothetical protein
MEGEMREVNIKTMQGEIKIISVPAGISIPDLKTEIATAFGI